MNKPKETPRTSDDKDAREKELISLRQVSRKLSDSMNKFNDVQTGLVWLMVFNNISVITRQSVLLMEETGKKHANDEDVLSLK